MRACVFDPPKSEYPVEPRQSTLPNSYFTACARSSGVFRPRSDILSYPIRFSCGLMARHPPLSPPRPPRPRRPSGPWLAARHPRVYQRFYDVCRPAPGPLLLFITVAPWRGALIRAGLMKVAWMISKSSRRNITFHGVWTAELPRRFSSVVLFGQGGHRETRFLLGLVREQIRSFLLFV